MENKNQTGRKIFSLLISAVIIIGALFVLYIFYKTNQTTLDKELHNILKTVTTDFQYWTNILKGHVKIQ